MKLIDLLVQHLGSNGGWPIGAGVCAQDNDGEVCFYTEKGIHRHNGRAVWSIPEGVQSKLVKRRIFFTPAEDMVTSVVCREQYEAALAAPKQVEWDANGRPGIGVTCEHCPGGTTQTEWEVVTVLGISARPGGMFTDYWLRKEDGSSYIIGNPYRFRPIRTEAELKRELFLNEMFEFARQKPLDSMSDLMEQLYDAIENGEIKSLKFSG